MFPPIILMYHSMDDRAGQSDTWGLSVSPDNFAAQIEALVSERTVVSLEELLRRAGTGRVPEGYAAITFDDGYVNNLTVAKPILERYDAPATLFLMTGAVDSPGFWWDRLERIVTEADFLPAVFSIPLPDCTFEIMVEGTDRTKILHAIWGRLRELEAEARDMALTYLADVLNAPPAAPALRALTSEEVQQLDGGIFVVGAHTHSHPNLPRLNQAQITHEVDHSKVICESILGRQVTAFSYPFGDHDDRVRTTVADCGFKVACTVAPRPVGCDDDCLLLPRIGVADWTADQFIRSLPGNAPEHEQASTAGRSRIVNSEQSFGCALGRFLGLQTIRSTGLFRRHSMF